LKKSRLGSKEAGKLGSLEARRLGKLEVFRKDINYSGCEVQGSRFKVGCIL